MQLYNVLFALPAWLTGNAKWIAIGVAALVVLIAFISGASKGFTRMGWGPLIWAGACTLFFVLESKYHDANPILKIGAVSSLSDGVKSFASTLSIALVCIFAALGVFGILGAIVRPKKKKKVVLRYYRSKRDRDEDEDVDDEEYDGYQSSRDRNSRDRKNQYSEGAVEYKKPKPCTFNRIIGGVAAVAFTGLILAGIGCLVLVVMAAISKGDKIFEIISSKPLLNDTWNILRIHTLDFLMLAVITGMGYGGYRIGVVRGFRRVFLTVAYIAAVGASFFLPFWKGVANQSWLAFVVKIYNYFGALIAKTLPESISVVLGKVVCGVVLCAGSCIVVAILGVLLKLFSKVVSEVVFLRFIDGALCTVVMMILGVAICALISAILYSVEYFGWFKGSLLFDADSPLMTGFYDALDEYLRPLLDKVRGLGK